MEKLPARSSRGFIDRRGGEGTFRPVTYYWTLNQVPELQGLTGAQQRDLLKRAMQKGDRLRGAWPAGLGAGIGVILGGLLEGGMGVPYARIIGAGIGGGLGGFIGQSLLINRLRPRLAALRHGSSPN